MTDKVPPKSLNPGKFYEIMQQRKLIQINSLNLFELNSEASFAHNSKTLVFCRISVKK